MNRKKHQLQVRTKTLLCDLQTPVGVYLKVRDLYPESALLESSDFHSNDEALSIIGVHPIARFRLEKSALRTTFPDGSREETPFTPGESVPALLRAFLDRFELTGEATKMNGLFGYTSAEAAYLFEDAGAPPTEIEGESETPLPLLQYLLYRHLIIINHFKHEMILLENAQVGAPSELEKLEAILENRNLAAYAFTPQGEESSPMEDETYKAAVRRAVASCQRGDVFQLVLSRSFERRFTGDDFQVYRALRAINPSPYLFYFDFGAFRIFGSSPETQCRVVGRHVTIDPIAGTVPRSGDDARDQKAAAALLEDPKENAEHVMLVDLARNDLSRCAEEVRVEFYKEVQFYSHVIHLVSRVGGRLPEGSNSLDVFASAFPAGTLSGAPKVRALQLIAEIEQRPRGAYGGAIGYLGFNGDLNHAITIRSFVSRDQTLHYQAGAGIVHASKDASELAEVEHKIGALRRAIELAAKLES